MEKTLLSLRADKLLHKFGAGNHKPGSGSAAAYQGLLAAQLLRTVISLTTDPKRSADYEEHISEFRRIDSEIETRIYPALEKLLQDDSDQFDRVIILRNARIAETDSTRKHQLRIESLDALKVATELPIEIAQRCLELTEFASLIFDHGFRSARGDSGVALNGALAAVVGSLSIIDLNLVSFTNCEWTKKVRLEVEQIRRRYREMSETADSQGEALRFESIHKFELDALLAKIRQRALATSKLTNRDVEESANQVHRAIWAYKNTVWKYGVPENPMDLLNPKDSLLAMGFQFSKKTSLGQFRLGGETVEVAGLIDRTTNRVEVSEQFTKETQNFTAAHELGHAILHSQDLFHRDKAIDGSQIRSSRDPIENQADKFAACFLMPRRLTRRIFQKLFKTTSFSLDDATAFALLGTDGSTLLSTDPSIREIARILAAAVSFDGQFFESISKQFTVSNEAMAIRLEELELVER